MEGNCIERWDVREKEEEARKEMRNGKEEEQQRERSSPLCGVLSCEPTLPLPSHGSSSWFSLVHCGPHIPTGAVPYSFSAFTSAAARQIEVEIGSAFVDGDSYTAGELVRVLERERYAGLCRTFASLPSNDFLPFLSLHSTQSVFKLNSILEVSFLCPLLLKSPSLFTSLGRLPSPRSAAPHTSVYTPYGQRVSVWRRCVHITILRHGEVVLFHRWGGGGGGHCQPGGDRLMKVRRSWWRERGRGNEDEGEESV